MILIGQRSTPQVCIPGLFSAFLRLTIITDLDSMYVEVITKKRKKVSELR